MSQNIKYTFAFILGLLIFYSFGSDRSEGERNAFYADESSYYAIAQSLAYDFDLKYEKKDITRIREIFPGGPQGIFLKKDKNNNISFAKSFVYPLFLSPFLRVFGTEGIYFFNCLMFFAVMIMSFFFFRIHFNELKSLAITLVFLIASVTPLYISWITADLFNFFVVFTACFFFFYPFKNKKLFFLSPFFFSLAVFSKLTPFVAASIIYLILIYKKEWKKFFICSLISIVTCLALVSFIYVQTGEYNFQGGERRTFYKKFPFEKADVNFKSGYSMSTDDYWERYYLSSKIAFSNIAYFLFGRYTGMFLYFFPAFFILIAFFFKKKEPEDFFIFMAAVLSCFVFMLMAPDNYFGGSGSIGNRYFLTVYPLFLFIFPKEKSKSFILSSIAMSIIFLTPTITHSLYRSKPAMFAGQTFPIKLFPLDKTQYLNLPSNEIPGAFRQKIHDKESYYWLYFCNNNFWNREGCSFWTKGNKTSLLFLVALKPPKKIILNLQNNKYDCNVKVKINGETKKLELDKFSKKDFEFNDIKAFKVSNNRYLFEISIKSNKSFIPYLEDEQSEDKRELGVLVNFHLIY